MNKMKALLFIFSLVIAGSRSLHWRKIDELKSSFSDYYESADQLLQSTQNILLNKRMKAAQFIDQVSDNYILTTSLLNETKCYKSLFHKPRLLRSFQSEILRSQIPLENILLEIRQKLDEINSTIDLNQDLADSKYSICKVFNSTKSCEEKTEYWLEGFVISSVLCLITPENCTRHVLSKRSTANNCPVNTYVCGSGECINPITVCDRSSDCSDGSDEDICRDYKHFRCDTNPYSNSYISAAKVCDGKEDCDNGQDELHCGKSEIDICRIEYGMHKCFSNKCIGLDRVCDGNQDCDDGTDEGPDCGKGICPEECLKKGGVCFHGPMGPLCLSECPLGTFETPEGCTAHPHSTKRSLAELLDEVPKLIQRQNAKSIELKMKATAFVSKVMNDVFKCLDPLYTALAKVISFPNDNQSINESHVTKSYSPVPDVTTESDMSDV